MVRVIAVKTQEGLKTIPSELDSYQHELAVRIELCKGPIRSNCIGTALYLTGEQRKDIEIDHPYDAHLRPLAVIDSPVLGCLVSWQRTYFADGKFDANVAHMGVVTSTDPLLVAHRFSAQGQFFVDYPISLAGMDYPFYQRVFYLPKGIILSASPYTEYESIIPKPGYPNADYCAAVKAELLKILEDRGLDPQRVAFSGYNLASEATEVADRKSQVSFALVGFLDYKMPDAQHNNPIVFAGRNEKGAIGIYDLDKLESMGIGQGIFGALRLHGTLEYANTAKLAELRLLTAE